MLTAQDKLNQALISWYTLLSAWSLDGSLASTAEHVLNLDGEYAIEGADDLLQSYTSQWSLGDFESLPPIVLLSNDDISGAQGPMPPAPMAPTPTSPSMTAPRVGMQAMVSFGSPVTPATSTTSTSSDRHPARGLGPHAGSSSSQHASAPLPTRADGCISSSTCIPSATDREC